MIAPGVYRKGEAGFLAPGSAEWSELITPSKVAPIFGGGRWDSPYRLWFRMKGLTPPEPDKDDFRAGHAFEHSLAEFWKTDYTENKGWQLSAGEVQFVGDASKYGFPYAATIDRRARSGALRRVVEFKTCRGFDDWGDEFTDEAPTDYVLQVTAQMLFTGYTKEPAHLLVLNKIGCGRNLYRIRYNPDYAAAIIDECRAFYESLQSDTPPPLDDHLATYECVREQHPDIDGDESVEIPADLADEYHDAIEAADAAEKRERFAKTQVLDLMKRAKYAVSDGDGQRVARRQPGTKGAVALYRIKPGTKAALAGQQQHQGEPAA